MCCQLKLASSSLVADYKKCLKNDVKLISSVFLAIKQLIYKIEDYHSLVALTQLIHNRQDYFLPILKFFKSLACGPLTNLISKFNL